MKQHGERPSDRHGRAHVHSAADEQENAGTKQKYYPLRKHAIFPCTTLGGGSGAQLPNTLVIKKAFYFRRSPFVWTRMQTVSRSQLPGVSRL